VGPNRRRSNARAADAVAVSVVAWVRVGVAIAIAAFGSLPHDLSTSQSTLFIGVGLLYVPWSVVLLLASERAGDRVAAYGGPVGDLLMLFAVQLLAPSAAEAVLSGVVVVIAFAAYTAGRFFAAVLAALGISLALLASSVVSDAERVSSSVIAALAVAAVAMVFLLDRTSSLQAREIARAARLQSTADAVLERIADGVVVTDAAGVVLSCNPAAERITGLEGDTTVGHACAAVLGLHDNERALDCSAGCELLRAHHTDGDLLGHEVWRSRNGRRQPLLANATAVTDDDGVVLEVVHSLRDITRLKQSEEAKTLFLATASHELKTPLTVIRGFAETLLDHDHDAGGRALALKAIQRRTVELGDIVDRLLLSSRIEAGRIDLSLTSVALTPMLEERVIAMAGATGRTIDLQADGVSDVLGDGAAIATVLDHLIDNAVKYSPDGGTIIVRAATGDRVAVSVSDDGIGMDREQAAHCFDKFWQAESTDVRRFGGTGIGLYIVRSLVEAMGGRISVVSQAGAGSTFTVELLPAGAAVAEDPMPGVGESTSIREFMRQIGVREGRPRC
jgi:PAS domain S-box-containing protein